MSLHKAVVLVALGAALASAAGAHVRATYGARVSADEPQYLLTAISLAEDRNIDIADEIAERRYLPFHEIPLDRQTAPLPDGSEISPHDPLLSLLLALPVQIGGWIAAKSTLSLLNGALGALLVWIAVRRFAVGVPTAAIAAAAFTMAAPLAVYGNQIYPELPAALVVAIALAGMTGARSRGALTIVGVCIVALPWMSVKYVPVAAVLAVATLWLLLRDRRRPAALVFAGALGGAGLLYLAAHLAWYGGMTVYAAGDHFVPTGEFGVVGTDVNLIGRSSRLIGLLVDDKFGLFVWHPAFLLGLPALGGLARVRPRGSVVVAAVLAAGWLTATFVALTMQGWWWPGRQTVIVLPALVLAIAWWCDRGAIRRRLLAGLGAVGVLTYGWVVAEGLSGRLTWIVDFFETTAPWHRVATLVTPDYLEPSAGTWALHGAWIAIAGGLFVAGFRSEHPSGGYGVEAEPEPVAEPEPEPDAEPDPEPDSEPSTSRTPAPSSPQAAPASAATAASAANARFVPVRILPPAP